MSDFDKVAADWDKNRMHLERSEAIAAKLLPHLYNKNLRSALEFGAGTGLLSFLLKSHFNEMTLLDSSQEMVNITNSKIAESGNSHMKAVFLDLEKEEFTGRKFDVIFSQMALHHVGDIELLFRKFSRLINSPGILAIADLYTENGSFHGEHFHGHYGFNPENLKDSLSNYGFNNISYEQCYSLTKEVNEGITREFPIFLLVAER